MSDGYGFSSEYAIADKCCGQPSVLKGLGWKVIRIWSCEWYKNPDVVLGKILNDLKDITGNKTV